MYIRKCNKTEIVFSSLMKTKCTIIIFKPVLWLLRRVCSLSNLYSVHVRRIFQLHIVPFYGMLYKCPLSILKAPISFILQNKTCDQSLCLDCLCLIRLFWYLYCFPQLGQGYTNFVCWASVCLVRATTLLNSCLHLSHSTCFWPIHTLWCRLRSYLLWNLFSQPQHACGLSPECELRWSWYLSSLAKVLEQPANGQENLRSPCRATICSFRWHFFLNPLPQKLYRIFSWCDCCWCWCNYWWK